MSQFFLPKGAVPSGRVPGETSMTWSFAPAAVLAAKVKSVDGEVAPSTVNCAKEAAWPDEDEHADEDVARDVCAEARRATVASRAASMVARARCDVRARGPSPGFRHRSGRETRRDAGGSRRA